QGRARGVELTVAREIGDVELSASVEAEVSGFVDIIFDVILADASVQVVPRRRRRAGDGGAAAWWGDQYTARILAERAAEAERLRLQNLVDGDLFAVLWLPDMEATGSHDPDADVVEFIVTAFPFSKRAA